MSYADVARACDRWLRTNIPQYVPGGMWHKRFKGEVPKKPEQEKASTKKGSIRVQRDTVVVRPKSKYATDKERTEAIRQRMVNLWKNMSTEEKQRRLNSIQSGRPPKSTVPRHKTPKWKAYKREWQRKNRQKPLTQEQIQKRNADARRRYANTDPEIRSAKNKIRKERYAKRKAEKEKGL